MSLKFDDKRKVYVARWYEDGRGGRYRQKTLGGNFKKANDDYKRLVGESAKKRAAPEAITFDTLADQYVEMKSAKMTAKGLERTKGILKTHLRPAFGTMLVHQLRPLDFERYQNSRLEARAAKSTINREWNVFRAIIRWGERKRRIPDEVTRYVEAFKLESGGARAEFFQHDEWAAFVGAFSNEAAWHERIDNVRKLGPMVGGDGRRGRRHGGGRRGWSKDARARYERFAETRTVFQLLLYTGGRLGEIMALRWRDVDWRRGQLSIYQQKTGKTVVLPLTDALRSTLQGFPAGVAETPVLRNADGSRIYKMEIQRAFGRALAIAQIDRHLTPHSLRHTLGSWLASAGESLRTIQELLGHHSPVITAKHYAHLLPADDAKVRALNRVSEIAKAAESASVNAR